MAPNSSISSSLSSVISPLPPRPSQLSSSSHITKTYRQASQLFLTRRLPEALSTILPLVSPPPLDQPNQQYEPAPVIKASKSSRVKVWSLYLTILNAILELDSDEGKAAFGTQDWRALCTKVREGEVWEEVVRNGYHGVEGDVDADVVINLATILLAHAKSQTLNQKRLENWLAASRSSPPNLTSDHFSDPIPRRYSSPASGKRPPIASGTDTPHDLNSRIKILELYTLHVLLRNNEWDYAKEFISVSPILDEERREAFLQALQSLSDEAKREEELRREREEKIKKDIEEARRLRRENEERERRRMEEERSKREEGERVKTEDFGVSRPVSPVSVASSGSSGGGILKKGKKIGGGTKAGGERRVSASGGKPVVKGRVGMVLMNLRGLVESIAVAFKTNPYVLYRMLAFIVGLVLLFAKKKVRERVVKVLGDSWGKVKGTVGMGTKVSYI
ncbi:hypothetical protein QBC38DRAFT_395288 [Podospora fimiseda]|uniref:Peroxin 26 n=1 Tax=Podospora fimiseda TaxID=252190 RepID=A0AAN7GZ52_9PEZI|nr:hypothetical protein QBC38DRAFT_395288 [Podospora fimiseda]